ncbi:MAG: type I restriction endonuclease subunit R [Limnochordia bacterium]|nr:type I restriction endonuclease subunit R [Limnochordia bacterium]
MTGYSEDSLIEQPAIALLGELGWQTFNAYDEFAHGLSTLGRESKSEAILTTRLRSFLKKVNPTIPEQYREQAIQELSRDRSRLSMAAANREVYLMLKNGMRISIPDTRTGGQKPEVVHLIDWENPSNNEFLLCSQFWVTGEMYTRRVDLVGFVNGIPLVFIELKATYRRLETAFTGNLSDYKDAIPQLFWPNALIILSNGSQSRIGSVTAGWEHFTEWKKIGSEDEPGRVSLEVMLRGVCEPSRLLDIVENFTLFQEVPGGLIKLVAKNHQYLGVSNAIRALTETQRQPDKLGVFWHTQGSGKSVSMIFFAQKVLRKLPGNWSFVIVTDRQELDEQIYKNFVSAGVVTEGRAQAESSQHLRQLLSEDHRYIFTLIHKFRTNNGKHPVLSQRSNIIVMTDEAHRSQYDTLALNMRNALPNASFIAFTGTPLIVGEEKTRQVFGDYISVYDFKQSVEDGATVPLYYENRIPELQLTNKDLNEDMTRLLEEAELDEEQEKKLEREFAREYHLITRDDRLEAVTKDIVSHFTGRGFQGKAMVICIDKATAIRMYDKVKKHWGLMLKRLRYELGEACENDRDEIENRIKLMEETDMAVVVSQGQNEIRDMQAKGLDIIPHRKRMLQEDLETKFKDPEDPFRLVFVCAMWMTGFDVPSCSTLYLDKPLRNHTLMQTIARANRVYPGKVSGLIVDYVGVFRNLEKALAIYGAGTGGENPVEDKAVLVSALVKAIDEATAFCIQNGIDIEDIKTAEGFARVGLLDGAVEALVSSEETKRRFINLANNVQRLFKAVLPDPSAQTYYDQVRVISILVDKIRSLAPVADISQVLTQVDELLDRSVATEGYVIQDSQSTYATNRSVDLSNIDFEKLARKFKNHPRTLNEKLKATISQKLTTMMSQNRTRMDYMERFQQMIEDYNSGSLNAEQFFNQLKAFADSLNDEEQRSVKEELTEEELALFDLLTKPHVEMTQKERDKVKATARDLLNTLKANVLVLDWRKRQQTRAAVKVTIESILDKGLPQVYSPALFQEKSNIVFQHVYDSYYGAGQSVYTKN